jgi:putative FmdB family regulatory protein
MIYKFRCLKCKNVFEVRHGMKDPHPNTCPICGHKNIKRVYESVGIIFNGPHFTKSSVPTEVEDE